jgi:phosphatidylserine/phosphatidylglycerophosphate/cardiolipin synthase-like enzyme
MGLPLQPRLVARPRWWSAMVLSGMTAVGLILVGWLGVARRPPVELIVTGPGEPLAYARAAERLIAGARHRVWVMQYVIRPDGDGPVQALLTALATARSRGVEVIVGLDRGTIYGSDQPDPKNDAAAAWLTTRGVPVVWDEDSRTTHAKVLLVDDEFALIGSHNWTRAALVENREVSVRLSDPEQLRRLATLLRGLPGWPDVGPLR